jgi:peptide-methionine (S)-S-oxide reductase
MERKAREDRKAIFSSVTRAKIFFAAFAIFAFLVIRVLVGSTQAAGDPPPGMQQAIFGGGCFWSMEHVFDEIPGVQSVTVGYTGGTAKNPSYEQVELSITGHVEAVRVVFDPAKVTYDQLLDAYWHNTDPTEGSGQFCDFGSQYRPIIFYGDAAQQQRAEASKKGLEDSRRFKRIMTRVMPASTFWIAEAYHQHYYKTHASAYQRYRAGCGRDARLQEIWQRSR